MQDDGESAGDSHRERTEQFVRLFSLHQRRIYAYILTLLPHRADAEDVLQESSAVIWRKFDQYEPNTHFAAWACGIARLEALNFRRRHRGEPLQFDDAAVEVLAEEVESRGEELEDRYRALADCLERLSPADRDLVRRRYTEQASVPRVAEQVGRPLEGLYKAFARIRRALHECIDRRTAGEGRR